jgi:hypothetical protein
LYHTLKIITFFITQLQHGDKSKNKLLKGIQKEEKEQKEMQTWVDDSKQDL